jgi:hypothetical protein
VASRWPDAVHGQILDDLAVVVHKLSDVESGNPTPVNPVPYISLEDRR